jgi:hypothetical protein
LNRRTAEQDTAEYRSKNQWLVCLKLSLFEISCSIFDIQDAIEAKAVHLKSQGLKPGE